MMTINIRSCIFDSPFLSKTVEFGDRTFDFDYGIDLGCCGIVVVELKRIAIGPAVSGLILVASIRNWKYKYFAPSVGNDPG